MTLRVDIIIVNWNSRKQLAECIDSIFECGRGCTNKILVVDNGSTDGSADFLDQRSDVELIRANKNLGFARACNLGAKSSDSDFLLFLNPDAQLMEGTLQRAVEFMEDPVNASVGVCGVQLIGSGGTVERTCARFPSPLNFVAHAAGVTKVFPRWNLHMLDWDHAETRQVDHVIGAFFLLRRTIFAQLCGFDEQFFVYLEDLDFSKRMSELRYRSIYLADVRAYHKGGGTSEQVKASRLYYSLRSRILYVFKHFSFLGALVVTLATLVLEFFTRLALLLMRGSFHEIPDLLTAYQMLWLWVLGARPGGS
jgi:GT2 family glycosyltransferase